MLGGIFETWRSSGGAFIESFSILTTTARGAIAQLHDRMPIVLPPSLLSEWVRGDAKQAMSLALSLPDPDLTFYRVGSEVGNARNSGPELIAAVSSAGDGNSA